VKQFLLIAFLLTSSIKACACSCYTQAREKGLDNAKNVFTGKILSRDLIKVDRDKKGNSTMQAKYTVLITERYKGKVNTDTVEILTGLGGGDCGFNFNIGEVYTIYTGSQKIRFSETKKSKKINYTSICTRTNLFDKNEREEIVKYCKIKGYS
jgi:hypothetical protein